MKKRTIEQNSAALFDEELYRLQKEADLKGWIQTRNALKAARGPIRAKMHKDDLKETAGNV